MKIVDNVFDWVGTFLGFSSGSPMASGHPKYGGKSKSLARSFLESDLVQDAASSYIKSRDAATKDTSIEDALKLANLPKASKYMGRDTVTAPSVSPMRFTGMSNVRVANAVASLAQRSTITDPNVQQMFMRPVPVTTRQGRRTQSLGSSELKRSLIT